MSNRQFFWMFLLAACTTPPVPPTATVVPPPRATVVPLTPTMAPTVTATPSSTFIPTILVGISLPQATATATIFSPSYSFPIQPASVAHYQQGHHDYPAVDILVPTGSTFVAVTNGVIDFVSTKDEWEPKKDDPATRGGLSIATIGDDGMRYYGSHLSAIAKESQVGARVKMGQVLGYTGTSGNARGTAPHLHFGISHPTSAEDWIVRRGEINPYPYLKAWEAGKIVTPKLK